MLIAGDIGGTKTRLALVSRQAGPRKFVAEQEFHSADYKRLQPVVEAFLAETGGRATSACFDVAGPVIDGRTRLTNLAWDLDETGLCKDLGLKRVTLLNDLNAIVHPAVIAHENEWMEEIGQRDPNAIAIVEAALILEARAAGRFDRLIVVTCHSEQRVQRFARRLGITEEAARAEVTRRMAAQIPDEEKIKAADFAIDNSGTLEATEAQVQRVLTEVRGRIEYSS